MPLNTLILRNQANNDWLRFENAVEVIDVYELAAVLPALERIEARVNNEQLYAAGFISYEAAPAFDKACTVKFDAGFPLLRFGLFRGYQRLKKLDDVPPLGPLDWQMDNAPPHYSSKIQRIKSAIEQGETYQVNYTVRLHSQLKSKAQTKVKNTSKNEAWALFQSLGPETPYAAYVDCDDWAICCASPELFFNLDGEQLHSKPMKGTAARGTNKADDAKQKQWLQQSVKNRAENVMIVDMIRNDISRIAELNSVRVDDLFHVETYPTVHQMTSRVSAKTQRSISDIFSALFPCASITGAPKINTMRLIAELEDSPRRIYTGTIGYIAPNRKACFNVAIRTALVSKISGQVSYCAGGGIVWDSRAEEELEEIHTKCAVLGNGKRRYFQLLESLLWQGNAYYLCGAHISRLQASAQFFGFEFDSVALKKQLEQLQIKLPSEHCKIRILVAHDGCCEVQFQTITSNPESMTLALAKQPIDSSCIWLRHKTTVRQLYVEAKAQALNHIDSDDVLLWNENGYITESSIANIALKKPTGWLTPSLQSGLLAGTYRAVLLQQEGLKEAAVHKSQLNSNSELMVFNSVRQCINVALTREK